MTYWNWLNKCQELQEAGTPFVMAFVVKCLGSAPQEEGARMLITQNLFFGTVGGGRLEKKVLEDAREMLSSEKKLFHQRYPLGAQFGQCCGGVMEILLEKFEPRPLVIIYGAGHVATELVSVLQDTSVDCTVVDYRPEWLEPLKKANVQILNLKNEEQFKDELKEEVLDYLERQKGRQKVYHVVMTYQHDIDFEIIKLLIKTKTNPIPAYIGLIGSQTKWKKFQARMMSEGLTELDFIKVQCPIAPSLLSKVPREIAVGIAHEILTR